MAVFLLVRVVFLLDFLYRRSQHQYPQSAVLIQATESLLAKFTGTCGLEGLPCPHHSPIPGGVLGSVCATFGLMVVGTVTGLCCPVGGGGCWYMHGFAQPMIDG